MRASVVDLRYKMKQVLQALRRRETVDILYHGRVAGTIIPKNHDTERAVIKNHPFVGMHRDKNKTLSVEEEMNRLRGGRYHVI